MVTIKDVAKHAGVGVGSVSRYLNNSKQLSEEARIKIKKAIEETGYIRNELGRNLKTNNSRNVALLVPSIFHNFFSSFAFYTELELSKRDYKMIVCNSLTDLKKDIYYIDMLKSNKISGILGFSFTDIDAYITKNLPFVSIDRSFGDKVTVISADNYQGGHEAAKKLVESGCRHLAFMGTYSDRVDSDVKNRRLGFIDYCQKNHIDYIDYIDLDPIQDYEKYFKGFIEQYITHVDGVFVENDNLALSFIQHANQLNINVPKDLSVIGFDGNRFDGFTSPKLSTIVQPIPKMTEVAVHELIQRIEHKKYQTKTIKIPISFQKGDTTL